MPARDEQMIGFNGLLNNACQSTWGPDADPLAKLLIYQATEGSMLEAYLQGWHGFACGERDAGRTRRRTVGPWTQH